MAGCLEFPKFRDFKFPLTSVIMQLCFYIPVLNVTEIGQ